MVERFELESHDKWLKARGKRIGGSDIACIMGLNPWKSNVKLWREKMGIEKPDDISSNDAVVYGNKAEPVIRNLFEVNHPEYRVDYIPDNIWLNDNYPFAHASLDGWLEDKGRNMGVLEIKTGTVMNARQEMEWNDKIPDHYYCQVLWYMMVTDAKYAMLTALLKMKRYSGEYQAVREYEIRRDDKTENDIALLAEKGREFWESMKAGIEPPLILPGI